MSGATETDVAARLPDEMRPRLAGVVVVYSEASAQGRRELDRPLVLGRDATADFPLEDAKVSRQHARLEPSQGGALVSDLGSHNGTFVDGRAVTRQTLAPFGAVVRVGRTLLLVVSDLLRYARYPPTRRDGAELVGGPSIDAVLERVRAFAAQNIPVLIQGATGTGKECVTRALHRESGRKGELCAVNCAAIPRELIESEIFGHTRGAFSGSHAARDGLMLRAHGGTLLLDEVGELGLAAQAKLLRALEEGHVRPVGSDDPIRVDVRLVSATNRPLAAMAQRGEFREDLLHRIGAAHIELPALAERREDIPLLVAHFLAERSLSVRATAMEQLLVRSWRGNVRELKNVLVSASLLAARAGAHEIALEHLAEAAPPSDAAAAAAHEGAAMADPTDAALRARLETALQLREGNVSLVGRDLGMHRARLYEAFERLGIDPTRFRR
jgi:DNA-binding NtrC family response regulator